jgi:predicted nucleic acid-binding Zn ribbon protein
VHYCDEHIAHGTRFCGTGCQDDYEKEQEAKRRARPFALLAQFYFKLHIEILIGT